MLPPCRKGKQRTVTSSRKNSRPAVKLLPSAGPSHSVFPEFNPLRPELAAWRSITRREFNNRPGNRKRPRPASRILTKLHRQGASSSDGSHFRSCCWCLERARASTKPVKIIVSENKHYSDGTHVKWENAASALPGVSASNGFYFGRRRQKRRGGCEALPEEPPAENAACLHQRFISCFQFTPQTRRRSEITQQQRDLRTMTSSQAQRSKSRAVTFYSVQGGWRDGDLTSG